MRILGLSILGTYKKNHADVRNQLDAWQVDVERQNWSSSHDIRQRYKSADFLSDNRVIFDIKGNKHRLVVQVRYQNGLVLVQWIGTHAEYSKKRF